jgi:hypothetical protein
VAYKLSEVEHYRDQGRHAVMRGVTKGLRRQPSRCRE